MKTMQARTKWIGAFLALGLGVAYAHGATTGRVGDGDDECCMPPPVAKEKAGQPVDLAICLDTSGSMNGLIDAAKQKLWSIVNDLALAKPTPKLRVALLTFGNDGHAAEMGWVRLDSELTEDLDAVSQKLFALTTNGGTEYVGRALATANDLLSWSPQPNALKLIVVAGNESAEQDPQVPNAVICKALIERGIVVNSIYCGNPGDSIAPAWRDVAKLADGQFAAIDQQNGTIVISTPYDGELAALSAEINTTYVPYGAAGWAAAENQKCQDANASGLNAPAAAARAMTKGGDLYRCSWDLVEGVKNGSVKLEDVKKEELPEKMRELPLEEKLKQIDEAWAKRQEIQAKIQAVGQKREACVAEEMKKQGAKDDDSFDRAVRDAIRQQAETKGFKFPTPEKPKSETAPKQQESTPEPKKPEVH